MKILVTGANGFIGRYWIESLLQIGAQVVATGLGAARFDYSSEPRFVYRSLDITNAMDVESMLLQERPDAILHAAALSKPDDCERDPLRANRINLEATRQLLEAAAQLGSYCCYISTDFVFDGAVGMYTEADIPNPINHYGFTKWQAELAVQQYPHPWSIVRTVLVYGIPVPGRSNLLTMVADRLSQGETYSVVDDQFRTPTYAGDLADGVAQLIRKKEPGIFHLSGDEMMTPYAMAVRTATHLELDPAGILRVSESTFQQPARRPKRTGLDIQKARRVIGYNPRSFEEGLKLSFPK